MSQKKCVLEIFTLFDLCKPLSWVRRTMFFAWILKCPSGHCYYWLLDWITLLVKFSGNFRFSWWIFLEKAKQLQRSPNVIKHWTLFASHFVEEAGILWFTISLGAAVQVVIDERCQVPHKNHWPWGVCISSTLKDFLQSLILFVETNSLAQTAWLGWPNQTPGAAGQFDVFFFSTDALQEI